MTTVDPLSARLHRLALHAYRASPSPREFSAEIGDRITKAFETAIEASPDDQDLQGNALAAWVVAHAAVRDAAANIEALPPGVSDAELNGVVSVWHDAIRRLLSEPAPNATAFAVKLELIRKDEIWDIDGFHQIFDVLITDAQRVSRPVTCGQAALVTHASFYEPFMERNAMVARINRTPRGDHADLSAEEEDALCDRGNDLEIQILNGAAASPGDAIIKLVALAQVSAEGNEPPMEMVTGVIRDAQRHLGIGYLYEPTISPAEQAA